MAKARPSTFMARLCSGNMPLTAQWREVCVADLSRNGHSPAITPEATYTPTSNRAGPCSHFLRRFLISDEDVITII